MQHPLPAPAGGLRQAFDDGLVVTWRNLKRIPRIPELAIFAILQSIMFVLLFAFVFGGAIPLPGRARSLPRVPDARHLRPDDRRSPRPPPPSAWPRTSTRASSTASGPCPWPLGGTHRPHDGRRGLQRRHPRACSCSGPGGRLGRQQRPPGLACRGRAAARFAFAMSWIGVWLGLSVPTRGGRPAGLVHHHLPHHLRLQRLRAHPDPARAGCSPSPSGTRSAPSRHRCESCSATPTPTLVRACRRRFPSL